MAGCGAGVVALLEDGIMEAWSPGGLESWSPGGLEPGAWRPGGKDDEAEDEDADE